MKAKEITIINNSTDEIIASSSDPLKFEGKYYFDQKNVNMGALIVTDRIYTCNYKGECFWIDLKTGDGVQENVAWVYEDPNPGFGYIKDKIGFWPKGRGSVTVKISEDS